ncbi:MAG: hypothetical protein IJW86_03510 [Clostridia bacterium]|nr:hypothetical protein [Clostridia bacterium]
MKDIAKFVKTITIAAKAIKVASLCLTVGATVHSLIPKYDKIEGIDTDKLIRDYSPKQ